MAMECEGFAPSPSPVERHYHQRYILRDNDAGQPEDTYIHFHDNGIAVIGLATSHCMMAQQETVVKVEWSSAALSASQTVLKGKRKKGSSLIQPQHPLCTITTTTGTPTSHPSTPPSTYCILAGVRGQLLEVNDAVITDPTLLSDAQRSQWEGHVAVVLMDKAQRQLINSSAPHALYRTKVEWEMAREARRTKPNAVLSNADPVMLDEKG